MKKSICLLLILFPLVKTYAQDRAAATEGRPDLIISGNIGGDASLISLGIEKLFFLESGPALAAKIGFGFNQEFNLFGWEDPINYFILPHSFTVNLGKGKRSFLEMGLGGSWLTDNTVHYYFVYPLLGYRYHPFKNPGFSFKVWAFYPFGQIDKLEDADVLITPLGVSFGIAL